MLRFKDLITLLNLLGGFVSILLSIQGDIFWAATTIFIAYFFDAIDGSVAKLTKTSNRFGAFLDSVCDNFSFGIAPAFLVYAAFREFHPWLASVLSFWLILCTTLRSVRSILYQMSLPGYFLGLNRPVSAMMIAALINSTLFRSGAFFVPAALVVFFIGLIGLSPIPYINHQQKFSLTMKIIVYSTLAVTLIPTSVFGYPWEGIFLLFLLYCIHPFVWIRGEERRRMTALMPSLLQQSGEKM